MKRLEFVALCRYVFEAGHGMVTIRRTERTDGYIEFIYTNRFDERRGVFCKIDAYWDRRNINIDPILEEGSKTLISWIEEEKDKFSDKHSHPYFEYAQAERFLKCCDLQSIISPELINKIGRRNDYEWK